MRGSVAPVSPQTRRQACATLAAILFGLLITITGAHDADRTVVGEWTMLPDESDVLPAHAALLPDETGTVLFIAGSGNDPTYSRGINAVRRWDIISKEVHGAAGYPIFPGDSVPAGDPATLHDNDIFGAGHVLLPDGRIFVAGGTLEYPTDHPAGGHPVHVTPPNYDSPEARPACHDFLGLRDSFIYDPASMSWTRGPKMQRGRRYPSLLSLGDGRVLALSGLDDLSLRWGWGYSKGYSIDGYECWYPLRNGSAEIFNPATMTWSAPIVLGGSHSQIQANNVGESPYLHLLPTGNVFLAGPTEATEVFETRLLVRRSAQKISTRGERDYGFSTLLALRPSEGYRARVFNAGGSNATGVADQTEIIDFSAVDPQWTAAAPMTHGRHQGASVLLPDGKVLVVGGSSGFDVNGVDNSILEAEMYDPATNTWSSADTSFVPRTDRSVALVLPDGRVLVAGSNPQDALDPDERQVETRIEIYSPPYLFKGAQANIPVHPEVIHYATSFDIRLGSSTQVKNASHVVLLRPGSTTHTRNFDQRLVELTFTKDPAFPRRLVVTGPPDGNIAPPGPYIMHVLDDKGVPSFGHLVRLAN